LPPIGSRRGLYFKCHLVGAIFSHAPNSLWRPILGHRANWDSDARNQRHDT
jgi:hypothetical protein